MNRFAQLLDRLGYEPGRNNKLRLMTEYFRSVPDPERGWALAALTGALTFQHAKPGIIRALMAQRADAVLFDLSYDYVGDLSETVALMWPAPRQKADPGTASPALSAVIGTHTHVATADEQILPGGTAYQTDAGMTGPHNGVIGMDKTAILRRFLDGQPARFEVATGDIQMNTVLIDVDESTGLARAIERLRFRAD